jgi:hypothetical protein
MRERICLFSPPTGLDAYSQNALELPHRVMPLLPPGISSRTRLACASQPPFTYPQATPCGANDLWWFRNINRMSIAYEILTHISLLMPTFALPSAPAVLTVDLHCERNAPLPRIRRRTGEHIRSFGTRLEPR